MASVEKTGPTIDDAIDAALDELDLDEDQVEIQILSEGDDGEPARVRVSPRAVLAPAMEESPPDDEVPDDEVPAEETTWNEELATAGREILEDLLDYMGFPGEVEVLQATEDGTPTISMAVVEGDSMGALIGRRGETLQALQFICQLLVNRRVGHWTRILLDVEGYRSRRERYLKDTALRAAEKALRYRSPVELEPMIPSERRIVHLTLADHEHVATHSEGEGQNRRIFVEPKPGYLTAHDSDPLPQPPREMGNGGGFGRGRRPARSPGGGGFRSQGGR